MSDFRNRLTIEVRAEDLLNGKPGSPSYCPVALAIRRAFSANGYSPLSILVTTGDVELNDGEHEAMWLSHSVPDLICLVDADINDYDTTYEWRSRLEPWYKAAPFTIVLEEV